MAGPHRRADRTTAVRSRLADPERGLAHAGGHRTGRVRRGAAAGCRDSEHANSIRPPGRRRP
jgi:hypothetical protein